MNTEDILDRASDIAFDHLERVGGNPLQLPEVLQTVVLICSVQGVIDNGGFRYLFESDFPGNPPYEVFSAAYRRISAHEAAKHIERAVAMLPLAQPHLHVAERNEFMGSLDEDHELFQLGDQVCGDESIWEKLGTYVQGNIAEFPGLSEQ
jgi:hypothetical protein